MPDLIKVYDTEGKLIGTCGYRCYAAKKPECKCICGGENHGKGFNQAMAQTASIVDKVVQNETDGRKIVNEAKDLKLIECQGTEEDDEFASHFYKKVVVLPDKDQNDNH